MFGRSASLWQWPTSSRLQLSPRTFRVITLFVNWLVQRFNASLIGGSPCNRVLQKPTTCLYWSSFFLPENPASYHGSVAQAWPLEGPFHVEILVLLCCCLSRTPGETLLGLLLGAQKFWRHFPVESSRHIIQKRENIGIGMMSAALFCLFHVSFSRVYFQPTSIWHCWIFYRKRTCYPQSKPCQLRLDTVGSFTGKGHVTP